MSNSGLPYFVHLGVARALAEAPTRRAPPFLQCPQSITRLRAASTAFAQTIEYEYEYEYDFYGAWITSA